MKPWPMVSASDRFLAYILLLLHQNSHGQLTRQKIYEAETVDCVVYEPGKSLQFDRVYLAGSGLVSPWYSGVPGSLPIVIGDLSPSDP